MHAPLDRIPVYVRGGSILTLGNERTSTEEPLTELTFDVYPGLGGDWTVIEDDGGSWAFQQGGFAERRAEVRVGEGVELLLSERRGSYTPPPRRLRVRLNLPDRPHELLFDGAGCEWTWDGRAAELSWPDEGAARRIVAR